MYDVLKDFVNHIWNSSSSVSSTEQQIYLYGAIALSLLLFAIVSDGAFGIFRSICRRKGGN